VYFGAQIGGVYGVLIGQALGSILFGLGGVWVGYRLIDKITATEHFKADEKPVSEDDEIELEMSPTSSPQSSSYIQLAQLNEEPLCEEIVRDGDLDNPLSSKDK
jgi:hypothetical protein